MQNNNIETVMTDPALINSVLFSELINTVFDLSYNIHDFVSSNAFDTSYNALDVFNHVFETSYNALDASDHVFDTVIQRSLHEAPAYKQVITETEYNKLPQIIFTTTAKDINTCCPITQTDFIAGDLITQLPCNHYFDPPAIKKWLLEEKSECPVCRYSFEKTVLISTTAIPANPPPMTSPPMTPIYNTNNNEAYHAPVEAFAETYDMFITNNIVNTEIYYDPFADMFDNAMFNNAMFNNAMFNNAIMNTYYYELTVLDLAE